MATWIELESERDALREMAKRLRDERDALRLEREDLTLAFAKSINVFRDRVLYLESVLRDVRSKLTADGYEPGSDEVEAITKALPPHDES